MLIYDHTNTIGSLDGGKYNNDNRSLLSNLFYTFFLCKNKLFSDQSNKKKQLKTIKSCAMKISQLQPQNAKALNKQTSLKEKKTLNYIPSSSDSQSRVHDIKYWCWKCFTVVCKSSLALLPEIIPLKIYR